MRNTVAVPDPQHPVPILAIAQILECSPSGVVQRLLARGVPVLIRLDGGLVLWEGSDYETLAEKHRGSGRPVSRSPRPRQHGLPPEGDELAAAHDQLVEDGLAVEEEVRSLADERESFRTKIAAHGVHPTSNWVACTDVCEELDGEADVLVVHVSRWMQPPKGRPYGTLLQEDGSPGVRFHPLLFCIPRAPAVRLVHRPGEEEDSTVKRIWSAANELASAAESEFQRRSAQLAFDSPWKFSLAQSVEGAAGPRLAVGGDSTTRRGSFWRHGDERPTPAPLGWIPLPQLAAEHSVSPVRIIDAAVAGRFSVHVFARAVIVEYWPFGTPASQVAALSGAPVAAKAVQLLGSGSARRFVDGPVAVGRDDLQTLFANPGSAVVARSLYGLPYAELGDPRHNAELLLVDPPSVEVEASALWVGPVAREAVLTIFGAGADATLNRSNSAGSVAEVNDGEAQLASTPGVAVQKGRTAAYRQRDSVRAGLLLLWAFRPGVEAAKDGQPNFRAISRSITSKFQQRLSALSDVRGGQVGQTAETLRKTLQKSWLALQSTSVSAAPSTIVLGALVELARQACDNKAEEVGRYPQLDKESAVKDIVSAIQAVLPQPLADRRDLAGDELRKIVTAARRTIRGGRGAKAITT